MKLLRSRGAWGFTVSETLLLGELDCLSGHLSGLIPVKHMKQQRTNYITWKSTILHILSTNCKYLAAVTLEPRAELRYLTNYRLFSCNAGKQAGIQGPISQNSCYICISYSIHFHCCMIRTASNAILVNGVNLSGRTHICIHWRKSQCTLEIVAYACFPGLYPWQ